MPKKSDKKNLFTLSQDYVHEIIKECREQNALATDLLEDFFEEGPEEICVLHALPYVVEIMWLNRNILEIMLKEVDDAIYHENEDTEEEEYVILEETIYHLQALLISRYQSNINLNKISYSVSLH